MTDSLVVAIVAIPAWLALEILHEAAAEVIGKLLGPMA
jgi:hypothetical protein